MLQSLVQQHGRPTFGAVLGCKEQREMPPDHLIGAVALYALRPRIPRHHVAFGIEHVDGVIDHCVYQTLVVLGGHGWRSGTIIRNPVIENPVIENHASSMSTTSSSGIEPS